MLLSSVALPPLPLLLPLASAFAASGLSPRSTAGLSERQTWTEKYYASELSTYGCRPIIFIFARATIEPGNMGDTVGPLISNGLKAVFGVTNVATQGVDYLAIPDTNFDPGGAPPFGIGLMQILLSTAAECPNSKILASGYSQGAALTHRAIEGLNSTVKNKIAGVVTFGDTQTLQDGGQIRGFDINKTLIICNVGDVVCTGTLVVLPVHLDYVKWVPTALEWLIGTLLTANKTDPWSDGTLQLPSSTSPPTYPRPSSAPPSSAPPSNSSSPNVLSRDTYLIGATSTPTAPDPPASESGEPRSQPPASWTATLMILAVAICYTLL